MIIAILQAEILRCIFLLFTFFSSSLSFLLVKKCNEGQRLLIMSIIQIYLFNIKEEEKIRIKIKKKKHLFESVITIGFYNLLFTKIFLTHACFIFSNLFFIYLFIFF